MHETADVADQQFVGNADALLTIIGNLLSNAIRYTPAGGRVSIRHGFTADNAWVEVQDTGIGMTPEVVTRIFESSTALLKRGRSNMRDCGRLTLVRRLCRPGVARWMCPALPARAARSVSPFRQYNRHHKRLDGSSRKRDENATEPRRTTQDHQRAANAGHSSMGSHPGVAYRGVARHGPDAGHE